MNCTEIILSYKHSEALIKNRIIELSGLQKNEADRSALEKLDMRKNALETELYDIREVIRVLNEYAGGKVICKDA